MQRLRLPSGSRAKRPLPPRPAVGGVLQNLERSLNPIETGCDTCGGDNATEAIEFASLPDTLVVLLDVMSDDGTKLADGTLAVPVGLNIKVGPASDSNTATYRLTCLTLHAGESSAAGHWTTAKRDADGKTRLYDDERVSEHSSLAAAMKASGGVPTVLIYAKGCEDPSGLPIGIPEIKPGATLPSVRSAFDVLGQRRPQPAGSNPSKSKVKPPATATPSIAPGITTAKDASALPSQPPPLNAKTRRTDPTQATHPIQATRPSTTKIATQAVFPPVRADAATRTSAPSPKPPSLLAIGGKLTFSTSSPAPAPASATTSARQATPQNSTTKSALSLPKSQRPSSVGSRPPMHAFATAAKQSSSSASPTSPPVQGLHSQGNQFSGQGGSGKGSAKKNTGEKQEPAPPVSVPTTGGRRSIKVSPAVLARGEGEYGVLIRVILRIATPLPSSKPRSKRFSLKLTRQREVDRWRGRRIVHRIGAGISRIQPTRSIIGLR